MTLYVHTDDGDDANSEYLGNLVSQAVGAPTPGVYRVNKTTLWLEDVPGRSGAEYYDTPGAASLDLPPDVRLIGLTDGLSDIIEKISTLKTEVSALGSARSQAAVESLKYAQEERQMAQVMAMLAPS